MLVIIVIQNDTLATTEVHLEVFLSENLTVVTSDGVHQKTHVLRVFDMF